jgi:chromate transport protein ChrA
MKKRKPLSWLFLVLTILFTLAAISALIPDPAASKISFLGYRAHCTFAPWSSLIALALAGIFCVIRARFFIKKE